MTRLTSAALATLACSFLGLGTHSVSAESASASPSATVVIETGGPNPAADFYAQGNDDGFAEYSVASFVISKADLGLQPADTIDAITSLTLELTHNDRSFSAAGSNASVEFFFTSDSFAGNFSALTFDPAVINGIDPSDFASAPISLGTGAYTPRAGGVADTFTLTPGPAAGAIIAKLEAGEEFNIIIAATAADGAATFSGLGNTFDPGDPELTVEITAGAGSGETTAPAILALAPANGSAGHPVNDHLVATFDQAVAKGTGNITILRASDDSVVEVIDVTSAQAVVDDASLILDPASPLPAGVILYVEFESGVVEGLDGEAFPGATGDTIWSFSTSAPPNAFPLIAAGDVTPTSAVLWARVRAPGDYVFQTTTDQNFGFFLNTQAVSYTDVLIPRKVSVTGLTPDTKYYYRVLGSGGISRGTFSTPAELAAGPVGLKFGVSGDWRGELAPYPAVANADEAELDFFVALGDTIYADDESPAVAKEQVTTLEEFRLKHSEVYGRDRFDLGVSTLSDLRASTAIFATIDDHEVTNDFAGTQLIGSDPRFTEAFPGDDPDALLSESTLFQNGLQVFSEYNPIEDLIYSGTGDPTFDGKPNLYRYRTFGSDAAMIMLDTRTFRDEALPPGDSNDPASVANTLVQSQTLDRTLLGDVQLAQLKADLLAADAAGITWKFVMVPEPIQHIFPGINTDAFEGYMFERTEVLRFIHDNAISNVVFVAADVHTTFTNNLTYQEAPFGPHLPVNAFEITTGSVAYDQPTGEFLAGLVISQSPNPGGAAAFYNSLPIAPDADSVVDDKDDFVENAIDDILFAPLGFDPLGLDNNLPQADGLIDATLEEGAYFAGHTYGWTQFEIDPATQALTVTTYGVDAYTQDELEADPVAVFNRPLEVVGKFTVTPTPAGGIAPNIYDARPFALLDSASDGAVLGDIDAVDTNGGAADEGLIYSQSVAALDSSMVYGLGEHVAQPLFTVGETFSGTSGALNPLTSGEYQPPGILDGLGAYELDADTVRVFANHELTSGVGYPYPLVNGATLTGARVSYFDIDKASRTIVDAGLAYHTIVNENGIQVTNDNKDSLGAGGGLSRLCSANIVEKGTFSFADTIFFTGEEDSGANGGKGGLEYALDAANGVLYALPAMGYAAWESVTPLDTGDRSTVALLIGDDRGGAPLYLYVGNRAKGVAARDFLARNGLADGTLYFWKADNGDTSPEDWNGTNTSRTGTWVPMTDLSSIAAQDAEVAAKGGFVFSRPEDVATDPNDPTRAVMASTGRDSLFPSDAWGTTYVIDTTFADGAPTTAEITIVYDGDDAGAGQFPGPDFGLRSPDNLDWADDGLIYLQEDRSVGGFGQTSGEEASLWSLDPATGTLTRIAQVDRSVVRPAGSTDSDPDDIGDWETSGIVDVSDLFGQPGGSLFLFDVQAHSIRDGLIGGNGGLVQGGQLSFLSTDIPTSPFAIDPNTGVVSVADQSLLDAEISSVTLLITASDGTNESSAPVTVVIENDLLPEVTASGPFSIPETTQAGRVVGDVDASDANTVVTFSIEGNNNFGIDSATGVITFGGGGPVYTLRNGDPDPYGLVELSTFSHSANFDSGASEISAFDPATNKLFVINGEAGGLDVLDLSDPDNPAKIGDTLTVGGGEVTSASVFGEIVAVTSSLGDGVNGTISFFRTTDLSQLGSTLEVGPTPDMVTFAPDGSKILIAHEGEPDYEAGLDPEGSIGIFAPAGGVSPNSVAALTADDLAIATFNAFDDQKEALQQAGVRIFGDPDENEGFTEADTTVSEDLEPEFITIAADSSTAWITLQENNALAILDLASDSITDVVPLGTKDHSVPGQGLDASDKDDAIHIIPHPVKGMYMADSIANYQAGGQTYLVLANEGDDRGEDERIEDLDLDPDAFPQAEALQTDEEAGRLKVSKLDGDTDGDGDFDELFSFGSRSFSIRDTDGNLVFDSGDMIEQLTATLIPLNFNSDNDDPEFDGKSDSQGPEPEGIAVGSVNGSTLAFVGLEDVGGVLVFDITDPLNVEFQSYLNDRDFGANSLDNYEGSNTAPEGLTFISAADSPNGNALLVVSYEVTGTTGIYEIATVDRPELGSAGSVVTLDVKVSDGVNVIDVPVEIAIGPDQPPVVEASGPFNVPNHAALGTAVGNVDFNDGDGGASDFGLSYSLDPTSPLFTIDPVNGVIKVLDLSSLAIGDSVEVTVVADDGTAQAQTTVTIDVINAAPDLDLGDVVSTGDGLPNGTVVVDLDATDGSGGAADENVVYTLLDEGGPFAIDVSSGVITIADNTQLSSAESPVTVSVEITDEFGATTVVGVEIELRKEEGIPAPIADLRVATYNVSLNRPNAGDLIADLSTPDNAQARAIAEIIQLANPDVILLNEFDYDPNDEAVENFLTNYLEVSQNGLDPAVYPYFYNAPSNTGISSGFDLNNNGTVGGPDDAFGFGFHPGQFGMVLLSKYPIAMNEVRTFQTFLWKDMPGALLPPDPNDTDGDGDLSSYYSEEELEVFRLSSKSHWDVPVSVNGQIVHVLASHPTPPVFDDGTLTDLENPESADWNGLRNHDEIRFWADYIDPRASGYIYDDAGEVGGLKRGSSFVIVGDQNADPVDGDSSFAAIDQLLRNLWIDATFTPESSGGADFVRANAPGSTNPEAKTASFNLRADYVLPSVTGLDVADGAIFWPDADDVRADEVTTTDHRLVYLDLEIEDGALPGRSFRHGNFDESAAEIVTFCPITDRFFVSNAEFGTVDVLDGSDPENLVQIANIPVGPINHVRAKNGILAACVANDDTQLPGNVQFFDTISLDRLAEVEVGALPDMLIFTPDGRTVITANEGEPNDDYTIDPLGSVSFIDLGSGSLLDVLAVSQSNVTTVDFRVLSATPFVDGLVKVALGTEGARFFGRIQDEEGEFLRESTVAEDLEPEYIAVSPDGQEAYVVCQENNLIAVFDIPNRVMKRAFGLGVKDHSLEGNGLDASNRDDGINIRTWPVFGYYMPDALEAFNHNGQTLLITANEGDSRDYDGYSEEERMDDLELDPTAFPNAEELQDNANLGRLKTTTANGDLDGDGDFDQLFSYGARSFTIWDTNGNIIYDSGDQLERIVAARFPDNFNATNDENNFDNRSDDKGPEPEAVTLGYVNGRLYAFVGLERQSGIVIFDITDPTTPMCIDFLSNRDFSVEFSEDEEGDPAPTAAELRAVGDLGPEGLHFISNEDSPNGHNLLAVANEVSGTTTIWNLDEILNGKFTLQVVHSSDNESKFQDPNTGEEKILGYSAVVEGLQMLAQTEDIPSVHVTAGDHTLPGPFYQASEEVSEFRQPGLADIAFYNAMNIAANGMGNHEFDGGIEEFAHMLNTAQYPFVAANLDFSNVTLEGGAPPIEIGVDGASAEENAGKVVRSTYLTVGGERIGFIGRAPADFFNVIEDPENTLGGLDFFGGRDANNQPLISAVTQVLEQVALLESKGINKIILIDHAQDFTGDPLSATSLRGIDIIVAAGSTGFMAQPSANGPFNLLRPGDVPEADYPTMRFDSQGEPVLVVNSDQLYTYAGNLIVSFDMLGRLCDIDGRSGPVTTSPAGVAALSDLLGQPVEPDPEVQRVWDLLRETPAIQDSFAFIGKTTEELVGARAEVRSRETNLGRLAADSTLWFASEFAAILNGDDETENDIPFPIDIALKNGGGIRSTILGPDIRRLAIEEALAFDNKLSLLQLTAAELLASMENAVSRYPALDGRFPQIAGMQLVFDPTKPGVQNGVSSTTPSRIQSLVVHRADGTMDVVVENFSFQGSPARTFGLATNSFLLTGGDGYQSFKAVNDDEARPTFETDLGEQDILEQYITTQFPDACVDLPEPLEAPRVMLPGMLFRYLDWAAQFIDPFAPEGGIDGDFNGDGLSNFLFYAFNTDPRNATGPNFPQMGMDGEGNPTLGFGLIDDPNLEWNVEISADGQAWMPAEEGVNYTIANEETADGQVNYTLTLIPAEPTCLYQIAVNETFVAP